MDKYFYQAIASVLKRMSSHGDHWGVLLACQDEKTGYHSSMYLRKPRKQTTLLTKMLAGRAMQSKLINHDL